MNPRPATLAIIGAGSRGLHSYAPYALAHPDEARVVGVADPLDYNRAELARQHDVPPANVFADWRQLLSRPRFADAVIISVQDAMHKEVAIAAAERGYHILLEKPMGVTAAECREIWSAANQAGVILMVCHVLRYAPYFLKIKQLIASGAIGQLAAIHHLEGVGWWTYAHAYVRGNWSREETSSFILLAKSCHDVDLIQWWADGRCEQISSVGQLRHFTPAHRPPGAATRCLSCDYQDAGCAYSAKRIYLDRFLNGETNWPVNVVVNEFTESALRRALEEGPYGRCVYDCDNDVMDSQMATFSFDNGVLANFTMSAFTPGGRQTRILGSDGYLEGDERTLKFVSFRDGSSETFDFSSRTGTVADGHGGGDFGLMREFVRVLRTDDPNVDRNANDALQSHLMTFAAEEARLRGTVSDFGAFCRELPPSVTPGATESA